MMALEIVKGFTRDEIDLVKRTVARGCTDDELALFLNTCMRTGLDPFARQIYCIKRWDESVGAEVMGIQTSIDGLRSLAMKTELVAGQDGPYWCGRDGKWKDVWTADTPPVAAKVAVMRIVNVDDPSKDVPAALFTGVALYASYCQRKRDKSPKRSWAQMGPEMLAKCAEALALRKAFPMQLSGLYSTEEMGQASNSAPEPTESHLPREVPRSLSKPFEPVPGTAHHPDPSEARSGPLRARVAKMLARLPDEARLAVSAKATELDLKNPTGSGFTPEDANKWLELIGDANVGDGTEQGNLDGTTGSTVPKE